MTAKQQKALERRLDRAERRIDCIEAELPRNYDKSPKQLRDEERLAQKREKRSRVDSRVLDECRKRKGDR